MFNILFVELTAFWGIFNARDCVSLVQIPFICLLLFVGFGFFYVTCYLEVHHFRLCFLHRLES